ncbi:MAG: hypothetical protein M3440_15505 [Chloroflexota bacterium]|nr:hypothetical protein [Chloroflexota bacterium]
MLDRVLIAGFCIRAGSAIQGDGPDWWSVDPPQKTVIISHSTGKDVSHYSLRLVPEQIQQDQWCTHGSWRQEYQLDSWAAYSTSDFDNQIFGTTLAGDFALSTVLHNPQIHASIGVYESVGDLLSDAHPDIYYTGVPYLAYGTHTCPIS